MSRRRLKLRRILNFKAEPEDVERWERMRQAVGFKRSFSEVIREALNQKYDDLVMRGVVKEPRSGVMELPIPWVAGQNPAIPISHSSPDGKPKTANNSPPASSPPARPAKPASSPVPLAKTAAKNGPFDLNMPRGAAFKHRNFRSMSEREIRLWCVSMGYGDEHATEVLARLNAERVPAGKTAKLAKLAIGGKGNNAPKRKTAKKARAK